IERERGDWVSCTRRPSKPRPPSLLFSSSSASTARMLIPFAMGVVTSFPFPEVSSPESKPIGVGLPEASQGDDEDDLEDESEDDEGRSCCCQGLIQQRKRKVSHHPTIIACHNVDSSSDASCLLFDCILLLLVISDVEKINAEMKQAPYLYIVTIFTSLQSSKGGEVTAAKGFNAGGMYDGLRASEEKPDLGIVTCDVDAVPAGSKLITEHILQEAGQGTSSRWWRV
ncbi:hypothetical protein HID58_080062, partial [Brassica napus]